MKFKSNSWQTFLKEIKRRKVVQVVIAYVAFSWLVVQVADVLADTFETPNWVLKALFIVLVVGLPVASVLAWVFDITQRGIIKTKELPHPSLLDIQAIPIIFHASLDNSLSPEQRKDRFRDYALWGEDFNAQEHKIYDKEFMILFENSIDALRYAIRIQHHSQQLELPLKISVIEAREDIQQQDEENKIARVRALAADSQVGAIVTTKTVKQAIRNRGIKTVENALQAINDPHSKIEQEEYIIDPEQIHQVNQTLKEYSDQILYPSTPTSLKLASLVFLTVIAGALWSLIPNIERSEDATITVLPFENISSNNQHANFARGLSEDIFNNITKIPKLNVISRRSSQAFDNSNLTIQEIGELLNADWVLEGTINRIDDHIRVSMWITDSDTGTEQWNQIFNLSSNDILVGNRQILKSLSEFLDKPVDTLAATKVADNPNRDLYPKYLQAKGLLKQPPTMERLNQVEILFKNILQEQPNFSPAMAGLCKTYYLMYNLKFETSQFQKAEEQCSTVYQKEETNIDILIALAQLHAKKGDYQKAEQFIQVAQSINPSDVELIYVQHSVAYSRGDIGTAESLLQQALLIEPGYWKLSQALGVLYLKQGNWKKASEAFEKVVALIPNDSHGYVNLGNAYFFQGQFDKAALAYETSLNYQKDEAALSNIATMWFYHGDYHKAINYYLQAISLNPNQHLLWLNLADAQSQVAEYQADSQTNYQHTLDLISDFLKISPDNYEVRVMAAWCHAQMGNTELARTELENSQSINIQDPDVFFMMSITSAQIGEFERGRQFLKQSIENGYPEVIISSSPFVKAYQLYPL